MSNLVVKKINQHPDKDEILAKLITLSMSPKDVSDWLKSKYSNVNDKKFLISENSLKTFQKDYLDVYKLIQEDIAKTKTAVANSDEDELALSVQNSSAYKSRMLSLANSELDVRKTVIRLCD